MSTAVNDTLGIRFSGDKFNDFYLYDLNITEEISELYRAEAVVLSEKLYSLEQLQEILSLKVMITVSQRLNDARTKRVRTFNGIVEAVQHQGIFFSSDKVNCFCYKLTIESALSKLRHVVRKVVYNRKTPLDVISEILSDHHLTANFSEEYISRRPFNTQCVYNQDSESDFCFLKRLLCMYGLSFSFRHLKPSSSGLAETEIYFSDGERFPEWTDICYSDGRKVPDISLFNFRSQNEIQNIWRMDKWKMERQIGIDGVLLQETYPNSNIGSDDWKKGQTGDQDRRYVYTKHFHGYIREITKPAVDADVSLILEAQYRSFQLAKDIWTAEGKNLLLTPCRVIRLSGFYGAYSKEVISAMITKTALHARAKWPTFFSAAPDGVDLNEITEVKFSAMNYASQVEKRFCSNETDERS